LLGRNAARIVGTKALDRPIVPSFLVLPVCDSARSFEKIGRMH